MEEFFKTSRKISTMARMSWMMMMMCWVFIDDTDFNPVNKKKIPDFWNRNSGAQTKISGFKCHCHQQTARTSQDHHLAKGIRVWNLESGIREFVFFCDTGTRIKKFDMEA